MINIIYGAKGSGKTKRILDAASEAVGKTKGSIVFVGDEKYASQINTQVRFVDSKEYKVAGKDMLIGFVKGILASNFDITEFFIDGLARITRVEADDLKEVFDAMEYLAMKDDVNFTVTVSATTLPKYLQKYL